MGRFLRKHRRKLIVTASVLAVTAAACAVGYLYLLGWSRGRIERTIAERTGQPAAVEALGVDLLASPRIVVRRIRVGDDTIYAAVRQVTVDVRPFQLVGGHVAISSVTVGGLELHVPEDPGAIDDRYASILSTWESTRKPSKNKTFSYAITEMTADDAKVFLGDNPKAVAVGRVRITNVLSDTVAVDTVVDFPQYGDDARLKGDVRVEPAEQGLPRVEGKGTLDGLHVGKLPLTNPPEGLLTATFEFRDEDEAVGLAIDAQFASDAHPAMAGSLGTELRWSPNAFEVRNAVWQSPGLSVHAEATRPEGKPWHVEIQRAKLSGDALGDVLAMAERPRVRFEAGSDASFDLSEFAAEYSETEQLRLVQGDLRFQGVNVIAGDDAQAAQGVHGHVSVANNVVNVEELRGDAFRVAGTVKPDFAKASYALDLTAQADLRAAQLRPFFQTEALKAVAGHVDVSRCSGTYVAGKGIPSDLVIEGTMSDGSCRYETDALLVDLQSVGAKFTSGSEGIHATAQGSGAAGGSFSLTGEYAYDGQTWNGRIETAPDALLTPMLRDEDVRNVVQPVLAAYGSSTWDARVELPTAKREGVTLRLSRGGEWPFAGQASAAPAAGGAYRIGAIQANATLPMDKVIPGFFPKLTSQGAGRFTFANDPDAQQFEAQLDLDSCSVVAEPYFEKQSGDTLRIAATGTSGETWDLKNLRIDVLDESVPVAVEPGGGLSAQFDLQLAKLAPLLPEGGSAGGAVSGQVRTAPLEGHIDFKQAAIKLNQDIALDRIDGAVTLASNTISSADLKLHGARSDATVTAMQSDGRWQGSVKGNALNVDAVVAFVDAAEALQPEIGIPAGGTGAAPASLWNDPFLGQLEVQLAKVHYRRGTLSDVGFRVVGEERAIHVRDIHAVPYSGSITGSIAVLPGDTVDAVTQADFTCETMDGRIVNDMIFPQDRGWFGTITGKLNFNAPFAPLEQMMAGGNGSVSWDAKDGSLGKAGLAGKLLTALKTVEVINLKLPSLQDKGITYDTWTGQVTMEKGVMRMGDNQLDGGAYAMKADGTVNFADEKTDVTVFVQLLESVSNIVEKVPLVGEAVSSASTDLVGVAVKFSGSPYDPKTSVAEATGKALLKAPVKAGEGLVKGVGKTLKKLLPGGGKEPKSENGSSGDTETPSASSAGQPQ